jgi:hypothetical protein
LYSTKSGLKPCGFETAIAEEAGETLQNPMRHFICHLVEEIEVNSASPLSSFFSLDKKTEVPHNAFNEKTYIAKNNQSGTEVL